MTDRVSMITTVSPDKLFVLGGINSLRDDTLQQSVSEFEGLLARIQSECNTDVYVMSVLPISSAKASSVGCSAKTIVSFNAEVKSLAGKYGFAYIDLFTYFADVKGRMLPELTTDGVHLTDEGYALFISLISDFILHP